MNLKQSMLFQAVVAIQHSLTVIIGWTIFLQVEIHHIYGIFILYFINATLTTFLHNYIKAKYFKEEK